MSRQRKPHPHHNEKAGPLVDLFGNPLVSRPEHTNTPNRKLWELMTEQADLRETERKAGTFKTHEVDELMSFKKFAFDLFGDSETRYDWVGGQTKFRYGGLVEGGPEEPGVLYVGFYIDPPTVAQMKRRRCLVFRGSKIRELEAQARLLGMMV